MLAVKYSKESDCVCEMSGTLGRSQIAPYMIDAFLNRPVRRSHRSPDVVVFQYRQLSLLIERNKERNKISRLYNSHKHLFAVDFDTFFAAYRDMEALMDDIVPDDCKVTTQISTESRCLYNYYEFDNEKIFFNLFFDEDSEDPIAQINVCSNGRFQSAEGSIKDAAKYLKKLLKNG